MHQLKNAIIYLGRCKSNNLNINLLLSQIILKFMIFGFVISYYFHNI